MGEAADDAIDRGMYEEELRQEGHFDDDEDYLSDAWPHYGGFRFGYHKKSSNGITCKFCQKSNLAWKTVDGKWRLFEKNGTIHICPKNPLKNYEQPKRQGQQASPYKLKSLSRKLRPNKLG